MHYLKEQNKEQAIYHKKKPFLSLTLHLRISISTGDKHIERTPPTANINSIGLRNHRAVESTLDINLSSRIGASLSRGKLRTSLKVNVETLAVGVVVADGCALGW